MKRWIIYLVFAAFFALHHDVWNWDNKSLWFGFLPAGLGYHAAFSLAAALFWYLVSQFAWPHETEAWAELGDDED